MAGRICVAAALLLGCILPGVALAADPWWAPNGSLLNAQWPNASLETGKADHLWMNEDGNSWIITLDRAGGARVCSSGTYGPGVTVSARLKTNEGNTSGIISTFYLSSLEGSETRDEIDFEFVGNMGKSYCQTNFFANGTGGHEESIPLDFDTSEDFHVYGFYYGWEKISWFVDNTIVREVYRTDGPLPTKPCFLYSSLWDASGVHWGAWAGKSNNLSNSPYMLAAEMVQVQWF